MPIIAATFLTVITAWITSVRLLNKQLQVPSSPASSFPPSICRVITGYHDDSLKGNLSAPVEHLQTELLAPFSDSAFRLEWLSGEAPCLSHEGPWGGGRGGGGALQGMEEGTK